MDDFFAAISDNGGEKRVSRAALQPATLLRLLVAAGKEYVK